MKRKLNRWLTLGVSFSSILFVAGLCTNDSSPTPAGTGSTGSCDFNYYAQFLQQTKYSFDVNNGCTAGWTQVWIRNGSNVDFAIRLCIQGPDGKWSCGLDKVASGKEYQGWTCGKALNYRVWAMPSSSSLLWGNGSCTFPTFP